MRGEFVERAVAAIVGDRPFEGVSAVFERISSGARKGSKVTVMPRARAASRTRWGWCGGALSHKSWDIGERFISSCH